MGVPANQVKKGRGNGIERKREAGCEGGREGGEGSAYYVAENRKEGSAGRYITHYSNKFCLPIFADQGFLFLALNLSPPSSKRQSRRAVQQLDLEREQSNSLSQRPWGKTHEHGHHPRHHHKPDVDDHHQRQQHRPVFRPGTFVLSFGMLYLKSNF